MTGVQFPGVTRAPFGVGVALMDAKGRPSMGRFSEVFSNAYTNTPHTLASIIPVQKSSGALPGSGLGAGLLLTAMAGGIAGWRKAKRGRA